MACIELLSITIDHPLVITISINAFSDIRDIGTAVISDRVIWASSLLFPSFIQVIILDNLKRSMMKIIQGILVHTKFMSSFINLEYEFYLFTSLRSSFSSSSLSTFSSHFKASNLLSLWRNANF